MVETILLLDIDGTLSPLPLDGFDMDHDHVLTFVDGSTERVSSRWKPFTEPEWLCAYVMGPVPFRPALVVRLNSLIESGTVTPRWLTTWDKSANMLTDVGLAALPWPVEKRGNGPVGGKPEAVERVLLDEPDARVVWCDDAIDYRKPQVKDLRARFADRLMVVRPKRTYGLTDAHMDAIEAFASSERAS